MPTICRACGGDDLPLVKPSNVNSALQSGDFAITDDSYGVTGAIYRCSHCGFMQCHDMPDVLDFYETLVDPGYETGRDQRLLQAGKLLRTIAATSSSGRNRLRLLDVGAGSGILVQAARERGIDAEGVEPSEWLAATAERHGCHVHKGVLPHPDVLGPYDIVTLIDVIEHVKDPAGLLKAASTVLASDGLIAIVTPDASSVAARIMGWRWWHYRIAHIGYFNSTNLALLCGRTGFEKVMQARPGWYFTVGYLRHRLLQYLPSWLLPGADWTDRLVVPLNLRDSILLICRQGPATLKTVATAAPNE
jgi:2-polyprenyl-3-methyl-5-hydroxy-6-metoxy-1,4-benzoquinol methylase